MARVETIVVGGGINPGTPFALQGIPFVSQISPPLLQTTPLHFHVAGPPESIVVSVNGTDPDPGETEVLRVLGGVSSFVVGSALTQAFGDDIVVSAGTSHVLLGSVLTVAGGSVKVVVGRTITDNSEQGSVIFGQSITVNGGWNAAPLFIGSGTLAAGSGGASNPPLIIGLAMTIGGGSENAKSTYVGNAITSGSNLGGNVVYGGSNSIGTGNNVVVIGHTNTVSGTISTGQVLGTNNTLGHQNCIVLGDAISTTANNQCWIGGSLFSGTGIQTMIIGKGDTSGTPNNLTVRMTDGTGSNIVGGTMTMRPGVSTGNATPGGFNVDMGIAGASGGTVQTVATRFAVRASATALDTWLMIWDVDNATLERVTVGVADSGGVGFKLLRIPN